MASRALLLTALCAVYGMCCCLYEPTITSLNTHPTPEWYQDAKVGIFIHWGVFSVPSFVDEWFVRRLKGHEPRVARFMKKNYPENFTYEDFAPMFTCEFFNPEKWARLFDASGARYVVLTSKHHEGYTLWPSKFSPHWNAMEVGPHRDLVGDLAKAIRRVAPHIRYGLYHSLLEWYHPLYESDARNNGREYVDAKLMPELTELVLKYRPEIVWADGDWERPHTYWNSTGFLAWLYNDSPVRDTVVANDRWGHGLRGKLGDIWTGNDRYNPKKLVNHTWENCMTLDKQSWGFRRNAGLGSYLTLKELITTLVETVSCNGNILINVGPTKEATITPIYEERLRGLGNWLEVNGEAVYNSRPWTAQRDSADSRVWYTTSKDREFVYAFLLRWPDDHKVVLGTLRPRKSSAVQMLGYRHQLFWTAVGNETHVYLPARDDDQASRKVWVLKAEAAE